MMSDLAPKASIFISSSNAKDFARKKRGNRTSKLKQCKLDARREQWLSLVKHKDASKERNAGEEGTMHLGKERGHLEIKPIGNEESYGDGSSGHRCSDTESSPSNSPTSHINVPGSNHSRTTFTSSSGSCSRTSSSRSSSISSNGCWGIMSEEDDGDVADGCFEDWEAVADALAGRDKLNLDHGSGSALTSPSLDKSENSIRSITQLDLFQRIDDSKPIPENVEPPQKPPAHCRAWKADDAFRPQCLPTLSKQSCFPLNPEKQFVCEGSVWECKNVRKPPVSCPICCEDFDCTDSSFLPCMCGYRLCLFCHKRLLVDDGRCPGCRKYYDQDPVEGNVTFDEGQMTCRLSRSYSMVARF